MCRGLVFELESAFGLKLGGELQVRGMRGDTSMNWGVVV